jgi:hypothetical protein
MATNPEIHYRFIPQDNGVTLELWEPVPIGIRAIKPYRFRLRYDLASAQAAHQILDMYLRANPATQAQRHPTVLDPSTLRLNDQDVVLLTDTEC